MRESLPARVSGRLRELADKRGFKIALARRLRKSPAAITPYVSGERPVTLEMLEAVSEIAHVPLAELVAAPDSDIKELNPEEAALLRSLRKWPLNVTRALLGFVAFFADEEPTATQTRNLHAYWREMDQKERDWFFGLAVMLREGLLPPDLQAGLTARLEAELHKRRVDAAKTRPKRRDATT